MNISNDDKDLDHEESPVDDYDIRFTVERSLMASEEPSEYIIDIRGDVLFNNVSSTPEVAGWISARVVQAARACNDGESLFDVCDSIDQNLHEYASAAYDFDSGDIKESISDGCAGADILIVESIEITQAHRGRRVGLLAMRRTIDTFGGSCAAVIIKPFPLQFGARPDRSSPDRPEWETRMSMSSFDADEKVAFAKLSKYWAQLGFRRIGRTEYYALDMQTKQPRCEDLMR